MDDLFSLILRFLGHWVLEVVLGAFFYFIGWPFVKLVTLGRYPDRGWLSGPHRESYVCCVGIVVFAVLLVAVLGQF